MENRFLPPTLGKLLVTLIAIFLLGNLTALAQDKYSPKYLTEKNDPLTRDAKTLTQNGWIEMKEETSVTPDQFFERYGTSLGLAANPHLKFEQVKSETGAKGTEHRRYQLYYDDVKVEGLEFFLHSRDGKVRSASGKIVSALEINTEKRLSEAIPWPVSHRPYHEMLARGMKAIEATD